MTLTLKLTDPFHLFSFLNFPYILRYGMFVPSMDLTLVTASHTEINDTLLILHGLKRWGKL